MKDSSSNQSRKWRNNHYEIYCKYRDKEIDYIKWCELIEIEYKKRNFSKEMLFEVANGMELMDNLEETLKIPITMFETDIFDRVYTISDRPCYLCARMRRGYLYHEAKKLGCNKIALGHHFDDVIETVMLSMLYAAEYKTMMPKLHSDNVENMELIRPMYYIREYDIKRWVNGNNLKFLNCACKFTERDNYENKSKRKEIKELIATIKKVNPACDYNIFKSTFDINLNTVLGYHKGEEEYSFLDDYNQKK